VKLASFRAAGQDRIGISLDGDTLVEVSGPSNILDLIETGHEIRPTGATYATSDITWHPPVRRPSKICCLALNNSANSDRILQGPKHPAMFIKPASALVGQGGAVQNIDLNKLGGPVSVTIEKIGTLTNDVIHV